MNTKSIADAIAARFTGLTATSGGVTESLISEPTASLPTTVSRGPVILVFHPEGELIVAMRHREDVLTFPVRLLRDPLDVPTRSDWLYAWYDAMRDLVEAQMTLGLAYVAWAQPTAARVAIEGHEYAGIPFDVVELTVTVRLNEVVSTLGA
jgi:hypothetical protein